MPRGRPSLGKHSRSNSNGNVDGDEDTPSEDFFAVRSPPKRGRMTPASPSPKARTSSTTSDSPKPGSPVDKKQPLRSIKCVEPTQPSDLPLAPLFVKPRRSMTSEELREKLVKDSEECEKIVAKFTSDCAEMNPFFTVRQVPSASPSDSPMSSQTPSLMSKEKDIPQSVLWPGMTHVHQIEDMNSFMVNDTKIVLIDVPDYDELLRMEMDQVSECGVLPQCTVECESSDETVVDFESLTMEQCFSDMDFVLRHKAGDISETLSLFNEFSEIFKQSPQGSLLWSEKYHPRKQSMICGNSHCFSKLSRWLSTWATPVVAPGVQSVSPVQAETLFPMFTRSDSEDSREESSRASNLFVLQGQGSCCKTAGVFACAEERCMEVIEINASECRSGKNVLERTAEASASKQIAVLSNSPFQSSASLGDFPAPDCSDDKSSTSEESSITAVAGVSTTPKGLRRVFLFEDVDVFFDGDNGLHSAILTLVQTTNYPVVATCREVPKEMIKFKEYGKFVTVTPPSAQEIAYHVLFFILLECHLLDKNYVPNDHSLNLICSIYALARFISKEMGLRGLSTFLQFWASSVNWYSIRPLAFLYFYLGIHDEDDDFAGIARDIENAHLIGCDIGFDSWLRWRPTKSFETKETKQQLADLLWSTAEGFSLLDVCSSFQSESTRLVYMARSLSGVGWQSPRQTLYEWSRLNFRTCDYEATILDSYKRSTGVSFKNESVPWHVSMNSGPPSTHNSSAPTIMPIPPNYKVLNPRQLPGTFGGIRPPVWQLLCNTPLSPFATPWTTDILPTLRAICSLENIRRAGGQTRRFTHHLPLLSELESVAILSGSFSDAVSKLRCDCCLCPLMWQYFR